jgi:hypothetical protein
MRARHSISWKAWRFAVLSALALVSLSHAALAQSITISAAITRRADRPAGLDVRQVNSDDCAAGNEGDALGISFNVTQASGYSLEVWAGSRNANCGDITWRDTYPSMCWQLSSFLVTGSGTLELNVRDIVPHGSSGFRSGIPDACATAAALPFGAGTVNVHFILSQGGAAVPGGPVLPITFDLLGPGAVLVTSAKPSDAALSLSWSLPSEASDTKGYALYCEPAVIDDSGACRAETLDPGDVLPLDRSLSQVDAARSTSEVRGLENGKPYACGVSAFDAFANVGPLSNLVCGTPEPVPPPRELTGRCAFGRATHNPSAFFPLLALLACFAARRRVSSSTVTSE